MRCPSAYFLSRVLTFHSISVGGFLEPPPKYMSYSTLSRRNWSSSTVSSSSIAKEVAPFPRRPRSQGEFERNIPQTPPGLLRTQGTGTYPHGGASSSGSRFASKPLFNFYNFTLFMANQEPQAIHPLGNCI